MQLIYLVMSFHLLRQLGTLVSGLTQIFSSLAMLGISVRLVLFISWILNDSEGILRAKLLFRLQIPWLEVILTTVILLLVFAGSKCVQNSLARIVANTNKCSHITPVKKSLNSLVAYQASLCFQDGPIGVQVYT